MLDELGLSRGLTAGGKSYFQQDDFCKIGMKKKRKEKKEKITLVGQTESKCLSTPLTVKSKDHSCSIFLSLVEKVTHNH